MQGEEGKLKASVHSMLDCELREVNAAHQAGAHASALEHAFSVIFAKRRPWEQGGSYYLYRPRRVHSG